MTSEYELMRHALGVSKNWDGRWSKPYRNHFVASGEYITTWNTLVTRGYAERRRASDLTGGDPLL